ncbi:MAG: TonB-dependent receptor [Acidobacteria bacterium]|nr:TonB-dependent receptor [Acidobacteriota bacterium]
MKSLCLVLVFAAAAWGQAITATVLGTVTDSSGAVVADALVSIVETQTGVKRRIATNGEGLYTQPYLPPGIYEVDVEKQGFKKVSRRNIQVQVASTVRADFTLEPGMVTETIQVAAESPLLQTDRSDVNRTIPSQAVRELPIANRSFQALVGLLPGVTPPVANFTALEDAPRTTFYQANGQGNSANNVQVDGVDNNNPTLGLTIYIPPAESVQEVNISTSNFNAEFGRAGGAVVNVITRGGTNQLHGSLFHFHRNAAIRARNFFNFVPQPKPSLTRNQFGGTLGGPIVRNKTFYFGSFQGTVQRQATTQLNTIPVAAWRDGNFAGVTGLTLYDPRTGPDGPGRMPFAGNTIPAARIHPVARRLNSFLPATNQTGLVNNIVGNVPFRLDSFNYDGRVDHNFNERNSVFVKYNFTPSEVAQDALLGFKIGDGVRSNGGNHTAVLNYTRQFSPTLLMEARFGYNRYFVDVNGNNVDDGLAKELGLNNPFPDPISSRGLPRFDVGGMPGIGVPVVYPLINSDNLFNWVNTWSKTISRHTMKWGADVRRLRADRFQPQGLNFGPRGRFQFNPGTTALPGAALGPFGTLGHSYAAFLINAPDVSSRTFQTVTPTNRVTQAFFFFHDSYQVTSKLTLDLGLRYEGHSTVKPRYRGGASNYDVSNNSLVIAGYGNIGLSTNVDYDANNWAPRFGFAYKASAKSVIRGGYGTSYYTGRFGFTGGTLSTQFPVIYNVQVGVANDFRIDGSMDTIVPVPVQPIPDNGVISPAPNQAFFTVPRKNATPFVHSYSLTYQRELGRSVVMDLSYVGTLGRRLPSQRELNHSLPGLGTAGLQFNRLFGRTASVAERANAYNSNYNALQLNLQRRFNNGLSFGVAYTWSKVLSVQDDQGGFVIVADVRRNYGPTSFDRTHMLVLNHIYELPVGAGKKYAQRGPAKWILGGWQLNGILRAVSGSPFNITADAGQCNCPGNGQFADVAGSYQKLGAVGPGERFFNTSAFVAPAPGRFGNAGRNIGRGPVLANYDFSVFRNFDIREGWRLEFRSEFYNLTNTPQFANPSGNVNAGNFGQITGTFAGAGEREVQFALRLRF